MGQPVMIRFENVHRMPVVSVHASAGRGSGLTNELSIQCSRHPNTVH